MPDPFEALRTPITPVDPDPSFTARLRARLERALALPTGVTVSTLTLEPDPTTTAAPAVITPYLAVAGATRALDWYAEAFGARRRGEPIVMPDGRVGHAELEIGGAPVMLSDEYPEIGVVAPALDQGVPVTIHLHVTDVDALIDRAVAAGATLERAAADFEYGRNGVIRDPFGHRWMIMGAPTPVGPRHGDLGYVSLWVPDVARASVFFATVLGWRYAAGSGPEGRQVEGQSLHHGLWGGELRSTLFLCFAVQDVQEAAARVRASGGTATEPSQEPYGLLAECVDDQGVRFAVYEPPGGVGAEPGPPNRTRHGDLAYVTMEVVDAAAARSFYGSVLGWRFAPGRVEDGWQVDDVIPMVGMHGGHDVATGVPMYRVDDIAAAVDRVRAAGGTATDPEVLPYGVSSTCADDQGTRFYLGQLR
ncbi:MAG TPA: VOC family protein [Acidimicrobiia bacterium]|nr:VOC family protein [Acidimicrobiia bacterium]